MTYFGFLGLFLVLPIGALLGVLARRSRLRRAVPQRLTAMAPAAAIALTAVVAIAYTTPWDNYLVATRVWWYDVSLVSGVILGYVPLEEYLFFILQTILTGLLLLVLFGRAPASIGPTHGPPRVRTLAFAPVFLLWLAACAALASGPGPARYAALLLGWALPPILIQVAFGADLLWKNHRVVLPAILASTAYLAAADVMAVSAGTWSFDPDSISGLRLGPLPLEEVLFFLVTNTLVVFSTTLLVSEESMARFRRLVGRARPSGSRTKATGSHPGRRARGGGESKMREVLDELRSVVLPRAQWFDAILPPVVLLAAWPLSDPYAAMIATCAAAGALGLFRAVRRESTTGAMIGVAGSAAAFVLWLRYGRVEAFFLPDLVTQSFLAAACLVSVVLRRPLVAWTSHVVRRWPRGWYWHARVRPAYMEVTLAWGAVFLLQTFLQWMLLQQRQVGWMAAAGVLNGTPATLVLLVVSYLYGTWRLRRLAGPSIAEFVTRAAPPWTGQRRGF